MRLVLNHEHAPGEGGLYVKTWEWMIFAVGAFWGLYETVRRGFDSIYRQQREMNRLLVRIAEQLGCEIENDPIQRDVWSLLQDGRKIEAIKLVRARQKCTLREAKAYVDDQESARKL